MDRFEEFAIEFAEAITDGAVGIDYHSEMFECHYCHGRAASLKDFKHDDNCIVGKAAEFLEESN